MKLPRGLLWIIYIIDECFVGKEKRERLKREEDWEKVKFRFRRRGRKVRNGDQKKGMGTERSGWGKDKDGTVRARWRRK